MLPCGLATVHYAHEIDVDDATPQLRRHVPRVGGRADTGVIEQQVDPAHVAPRRPEGRLEGVCIAYVELHRDGIATRATQRRRRCLTGGAVYVAQADPRADCGQAGGQAQADPRGGAGDEHGLAGKRAAQAGVVHCGPPG